MIRTNSGRTENLLDVSQSRNFDDGEWASERRSPLFDDQTERIQHRLNSSRERRQHRSVGNGERRQQWLDSRRQHRSHDIRERRQHLSDGNRERRRRQFDEHREHWMVESERRYAIVLRPSRGIEPLSEPEEDDSSEAEQELSSDPELPGDIRHLEESLAELDSEEAINAFFFGRPSTRNSDLVWSVSLRSEDSAPLRIQESVFNSDDLTTSVTCTICLDNIARLAKVSEPECKHVFHSECLFEWTKTQRTCPLCRHGL
jgi:hypothetical protein